MSQHTAFIDLLFKKLRPDTAIRFIRKTFWRYKSEVKLLESIIRIKDKENISLEEAFNKILNTALKNKETWTEIRKEAEDKLIEIGVNCPPPTITTTISDGYNSETTTTII